MHQLRGALRGTIEIGNRGYDRREPLPAVIEPLDPWQTNLCPQAVGCCQPGRAHGRFRRWHHRSHGRVSQDRHRDVGPPCLRQRPLHEEVNDEDIGWVRCKSFGNVNQMLGAAPDVANDGREPLL